MSDNQNVRYDFLIQKVKDGMKQSDIEIALAKTLKVNPDKCKALLDHLANSPVVVEKAVTPERAEELKRKFESAGLITSTEEVIAVITVDEGMKCPACGHEQKSWSKNDPCEKCGVFPYKFLELQRKNQIIERERERLKAQMGIAQLRENKEENERREKEELEKIRQKLKEEMGFQRRKRWYDVITGGRAASTPTTISFGLLVTLVAVVGVWFARDFFSPENTPAPASIAKPDVAQAKEKKTENVMQKAVGQMIAGSKKFAQASGAADQFKKEIFSEGGDPELQEQVQATTIGTSEVNVALVGDERIESITQAATGMADAGKIEQADRVLTESMQMADSIKDDQQRETIINAVAGAQFDVYTDDARKKAATGDWRAANKAFSQAMLATSDITSKVEIVRTKSNVAKARADSGDFGGAAIIFMDAIQAAEDIGNARQSALALADIARDIAVATNDLGGAAERTFEKALIKVAALPKAADRISTSDAVGEQRIEAIGTVASYLVNEKASVEEIRAVLAHGAKDATTIAGLLPRAKCFGILARVHAEWEGTSQNVDDYTGKIAKLVASTPEAQREIINALAKKIQAEVLAANGKFNAMKGNTLVARKKFLEAIKMVNTIASNADDKTVKNEIIRYRVDAINTIGRLIQATGDRQAAAKIFALVTEGILKTPASLEFRRD
ncbi:hypothetical protein CCP3SC5AM1_390015 [Gammaproteobacteria bacterium]